MLFLIYCFLNFLTIRLFLFFSNFQLNLIFFLTQNYIKYFFSCFYSFRYSYFIFWLSLSLSCTCSPKHFKLLATFFKSMILKIFINLSIFILSYNIFYILFNHLSFLKISLYLFLL